MRCGRSGFYKGPIDGQVGPLTRAAVEAAQSRAHLPVTGVITTRTRNSFGRLGRPLFGKRTIVAGDFGLDVSVLQFLLARTGYYHGALDGFMGQKVDTAVRAFQQHAGLGVDGIAGPDTLAKLVASSRHRHPGLSVRPSHATYIVQPGDSLTAIATHYAVSMPTLARLNGLDPMKALQQYVTGPRTKRIAGTRPISRARWPRSLLGRSYPSTSRAVRTVSRVLSETPALPLSTRLTVASLTPTFFATSASRRAGVRVMPQGYVISTQRIALPERYLSRSPAADDLTRQASAQAG